MKIVAFVSLITLVFLKVNISDAHGSIQELTRDVFIKSQTKLRQLFYCFKNIPSRKLHEMHTDFPLHRYSYQQIQDNVFLAHLQNLLFILRLFDKLMRYNGDDVMTMRIFSIVKKFPQLHINLLEIELQATKKETQNRATIDLAEIIGDLDNEVINELTKFVDSTISQLPKRNLIRSHFKHCSFVLTLYEKIRKSGGMLEGYDVDELVTQYEKVTNLLLHDSMRAQGLVVQLLLNEFQKMDEKKKKKKKRKRSEAEDAKLDNLYIALEEIPSKTLDKIEDYVVYILEYIPEENSLYFHMYNGIFLIRVFKYTRLLPGRKRAILASKINKSMKNADEAFNKFVYTVFHKNGYNSAENTEQCSPSPTRQQASSPTQQQDSSPVRSPQSPPRSPQLPPRSPQSPPPPTP